MVSDSDLVTHLRDILRSSDLETATPATVRRQLEDHFGVDLKERKTFVRDQIDIFLQTQDPKIENNEQEEENELKTVKTEEKDLEEEEKSEDDEREREEKVEKGVKKKGGGFTKICSLSPQLQKVVGVPELARTEVVKKLWAYIREKDLQDPKDRRNIICDELLNALFRVKRINMFKMNKALTKHIWPLVSKAKEVEEEEDEETSEEVDDEEIKEEETKETEVEEEDRGSEEVDDEEIKKEKELEEEDRESEEVDVEEEEEEEVEEDRGSEEVDDEEIKQEKEIEEEDSESEEVDDEEKKEEEEVEEEDSGSEEVDDEETKEEEEEDEDAGSDEIDDEDIKEENQKNTARKRKKEMSGKANKDVKKKRGGYTKLCGLSPQLQAFTGEPELARTEVVKKIWSYIREKNLQNPKDRRKILCDEALQTLFPVKSIGMFKMNKALTKHIWPLDEEEGVSDDSPDRGKRKRGRK